ncbi:MAG: nickel pincer cofactor biosynthesis protein LarB [Brevinematia bacterium]
MDRERLLKILKKFKEGIISEEDVIKSIRNLPFDDIDFAKLDTHRSLRTGFPEFVFCKGKTPEQVIEIFKRFLHSSDNVIGTRADRKLFVKLKKAIPEMEYFEKARIVAVERKKPEKSSTFIAVVTGGTSDIPVAEEAAVFCELCGNDVRRVYDVGVAGIHRLFSNLDLIQNAKVIIAVAGMEGTLPGIIAGLVSSPVIAVPTSVGYGANFKGLSALLTMLNSCSPGVSVVNIDNGFGAGYIASLINRL